MPDEIMAVLDHALVVALWVFLLAFFACLLGSFLSLRWRNKKTIRGLQDRFRKEKPGQSVNAETLRAWRSYLARWDRPGAGLRSAFCSAHLACMVLAWFCFSPWTRIATVSHEPPLRVTWLYVEPTPEGYRVEGDVWNQSEGEVWARAGVILLDASGKQVGGETAAIQPPGLRPMEKGIFEISVRSSPGAARFALQFLGNHGRALRYAKGFPEILSKPGTKRSRDERGTRRTTHIGVIGRRALR